MDPEPASPPQSPPGSRGGGSLALIVGLAIAGYVVFRVVASLCGVPC